MNGYAEILQEIEKNNEELRNLNRSRDAIKNAEKDMPREEFQKELSTVERFLASEQLKLENNKNIIQSYDNAYFLINDLDRLNRATEGIRDFQDRDERNAEIEAKRRELTANMQSLPLNLQNELRNRILAERTATITPEKNNEIERTSRGVYQTLDSFEDSFYLFQTRYKKAIFSHMNALYFYGLTEEYPYNYSITVPNNYHNDAFNEKCNVFYVTDDIYDLGLSEVISPNGNKLKAYDRERCICDIIKSKNRMDLEQVKKTIKLYMKSKNKDMNKLSEYSKKMGISKQVIEIMWIFDE